MPHSPERAIPAERHNDERLISLDTSGLKPGDEVLLYFTDGRAYRLKVDRQDEEGSSIVLVTEGRKSQLSKEIEKWRPMSRAMKIVGSCDGVSFEKGEMEVVNGTPGSFETGRMAWFVLIADQGEKNFPSPPIARIELPETAGQP